MEFVRYYNKYSIANSNLEPPEYEVRYKMLLKYMAVMSNPMARRQYQPQYNFVVWSAFPNYLISSVQMQSRIYPLLVCNTRAFVPSDISDFEGRCNSLPCS
jgi:hypothetical protein